MTEANGPDAMNDTTEVKSSLSGRMALILVAFVIVAAVVLPKLRGPARHDVTGTITHVDVPTRLATLEYVDPANGATRELTGEVPASCPITINGEPATLPDLKIGDAVVARGSIERIEVDGQKKKRVVAEEVHVTRESGQTP